MLPRDSVITGTGAGGAGGGAAGGGGGGGAAIPQLPVQAAIDDDASNEPPKLPAALLEMKSLVAGVLPPRRYAENEKALPGQESPRLTFEEGDAADDIPYRFDGDEAMETADARKKRRALRKHPQIVQWLKVFFRTFRDHDDTTGVHKTEYIEVHCLMTKALHKHFDAVEANTLANADWDADLRKAFELGSFKRSGSGTDRGELLTDRTVDSVDPDSDTESNASSSRGTTRPASSTTVRSDATTSSSNASGGSGGSGGATAAATTAGADAKAAPPSSGLGSDLKVPGTAGAPPAAATAARRRKGAVPMDLSSISRLPYESYCDSLFEVADIWTMSLESDEYIHFLATLFHRITKAKHYVSQTGKEVRKYVWRSNDDVKPSIVYRPYMPTREKMVMVTRYASLIQKVKRWKIFTKKRRARRLFLHVQSDVLIHNNLLSPNAIASSGSGLAAGSDGRPIVNPALPPELQHWHETMARLSSFVTKGTGAPLNNPGSRLGVSGVIIPHSSIQSRFRGIDPASTMPPLPLHPRAAVAAAIAEKRAASMAATTALIERGINPVLRAESSSDDEAGRARKSAIHGGGVNTASDSDEDSDDRRKRLAREARQAAAQAERDKRRERLFAGKKAENKTVEQVRKELQESLIAKKNKEEKERADKRKHALDKQKRTWAKQRAKAAAKEEAAKKKKEAERARLAQINLRLGTPGGGSRRRRSKPKKSKSPGAGAAAAASAAIAAMTIQLNDGKALTGDISAGGGTAGEASDVDIVPPSPSMLSPTSSVPNSPKGKASAAKGRGNAAFTVMLSPDNLAPLQMDSAPLTAEEKEKQRKDAEVAAASAKKDHQLELAKIDHIPGVTSANDIVDALGDDVLGPSNLRSYRGGASGSGGPGGGSKKLSVRERRKRLLAAKMRFAKRIAEDIMSMPSEDAKLHYLAQISELHTLAELENPVITARTAATSGKQPVSADDPDRRLTVMERFEQYLWMKQHGKQPKLMADPAAAASATVSAVTGTPKHESKAAGGKSGGVSPRSPPKKSIPPILESWFEVSEDQVAEDYLAKLKAEQHERENPIDEAKREADERAARLEQQRKRERDAMEEVKRNPAQLKEKLDKLFVGLYGMSEDEQLKITKDIIRTQMDEERRALEKRMADEKERDREERASRKKLAELERIELRRERRKKLKEQRLGIKKPAAAGGKKAKPKGTAAPGADGKTPAGPGGVVPPTGLSSVPGSAPVSGGVSAPNSNRSGVRDFGFFIPSGANSVANSAAPTPTAARADVEAKTRVQMAEETEAKRKARRAERKRKKKELLTRAALEGGKNNKLLPSVIALLRDGEGGDDDDGDDTGDEDNTIATSDIDKEKPPVVEGVAGDPNAAGAGSSPPSAVPITDPEELKAVAEEGGDKVASLPATKKRVTIVEEPLVTGPTTITITRDPGHGHEHEEGFDSDEEEEKKRKAAAEAGEGSGDGDDAHALLARAGIPAGAADTGGDSTPASATNKKSPKKGLMWAGVVKRAIEVKQVLDEKEAAAMEEYFASLPTLPDDDGKDETTGSVSERGRRSLVRRGSLTNTNSKSAGSPPSDRPAGLDRRLSKRGSTVGRDSVTGPTGSAKSSPRGDSPPKSGGSPSPESGAGPRRGSLKPALIGASPVAGTNPSPRLSKPALLGTPTGSLTKKLNGLIPPSISTLSPLQSPGGSAAGDLPSLNSAKVISGGKSPKVDYVDGVLHHVDNSLKSIVDVHGKGEANATTPSASALTAMASAAAAAAAAAASAAAAAAKKPTAEPTPKGGKKKGGKSGKASVPPSGEAGDKSFDPAKVIDPAEVRDEYGKTAEDRRLEQEDAIRYLEARDERNRQAAKKLKARASKGAKPKGESGEAEPTEFQKKAAERQARAKAKAAEDKKTGGKPRKAGAGGVATGAKHTNTAMKSYNARTGKASPVPEPAPEPVASGTNATPRAGPVLPAMAFGTRQTPASAGSKTRPPFGGEESGSPNELRPSSQSGSRPSTSLGSARREKTGFGTYAPSTSRRHVQQYREQMAINERERRERERQQRLGLSAPPPEFDTQQFNGRKFAELSVEEQDGVLKSQHERDERDRALELETVKGLEAEAVTHRPGSKQQTGPGGVATGDHVIGTGEIDTPQSDHAAAVDASGRPGTAPLAPPQVIGVKHEPLPSDRGTHRSNTDDRDLDADPTHHASVARVLKRHLSGGAGTAGSLASLAEVMKVGGVAAATPPTEPQPQKPDSVHGRRATPNSTRGTASGTGLAVPDAVAAADGTGQPTIITHIDETPRPIESLASTPAAGDSRSLDLNRRPDLSARGPEDASAVAAVPVDPLAAKIAALQDKVKARTSRDRLSRTGLPTPTGGATEAVAGAPAAGKSSAGRPDSRGSLKSNYSTPRQADGSTDPASQTGDAAVLSSGTAALGIPDTERSGTSTASGLSMSITGLSAAGTGATPRPPESDRSTLELLPPGAVVDTGTGRSTISTVRSGTTATTPNKPSNRMHITRPPPASGLPKGETEPDSTQSAVAVTIDPAVDYSNMPKDSVTLAGVKPSIDTSKPDESAAASVNAMLVSMALSPFGAAPPSDGGSLSDLSSLTPQRRAGGSVLDAPQRSARSSGGSVTTPSAAGGMGSDPNSGPSPAGMSDAERFAVEPIGVISLKKPASAASSRGKGSGAPLTGPDSPLSRRSDRGAGSSAVDQTLSAVDNARAQQHSSGSSRASSRSAASGASSGVYNRKQTPQTDLSGKPPLSPHHAHGVTPAPGTATNTAPAAPVYHSLAEMLAASRASTPSSGSHLHPPRTADSQASLSAGTSSSVGSSLHSAQQLQQLQHAQKKVVVLQARVAKKKQMTPTTVRSGSAVARAAGQQPNSQSQQHAPSEQKEEGRPPSDGAPSVEGGEELGAEPAVDAATTAAAQFTETIGGGGKPPARPRAAAAPTGGPTPHRTPGGGGGRPIREVPEVFVIQHDNESAAGGTSVSRDGETKSNAEFASTERSLLRTPTPGAHEKRPTIPGRAHDIASAATVAPGLSVRSLAGQPNATSSQFLAHKAAAAAAAGGQSLAVTQPLPQPQQVITGGLSSLSTVETVLRASGLGGGAAPANADPTDPAAASTAPSVVYLSRQQQLDALREQQRLTATERNVARRDAHLQALTTDQWDGFSSAPTAKVNHPGGGGAARKKSTQTTVTLDPVTGRPLQPHEVLDTTAFEWHEITPPPPQPQHAQAMGMADPMFAVQPPADAGAVRPSSGDGTVAVVADPSGGVAAVSVPVESGAPVLSDGGPIPLVERAVTDGLVVPPGHAIVAATRIRTSQAPLVRGPKGQGRVQHVTNPVTRMMRAIADSVLYRHGAEAEPVSPTGAPLSGEVELAEGEGADAIDVPPPVLIDPNAIAPTSFPTGSNSPPPHSGLLSPILQSKQLERPKGVAFLMNGLRVVDPEKGIGGIFPPGTASSGASRPRSPVRPPFVAVSMELAERAPRVRRRLSPVHGYKESPPASAPHESAPSTGGGGGSTFVTEMSTDMGGGSELFPPPPVVVPTATTAPVRPRTVEEEVKTLLVTEHHDPKYYQKPEYERPNYALKRVPLTAAERAFSASRQRQRERRRAGGADGEEDEATDDETILAGAAPVHGSFARVPYDQPSNSATAAAVFGTAAAFSSLDSSVSAASGGDGSSPFLTQSVPIGNSALKATFIPVNNKMPPPPSVRNAATDARVNQNPILALASAHDSSSIFLSRDNSLYQSPAPVPVSLGYGTSASSTYETIPAVLAKEYVTTKQHVERTKSKELVSAAPDAALSIAPLTSAMKLHQTQQQQELAAMRATMAAAGEAPIVPPAMDRPRSGTSTIVFDTSVPIVVTADSVLAGGGGGGDTGEATDDDDPALIVPHVRSTTPSPRRTASAGKQRMTATTIREQPIGGAAHDEPMPLAPSGGAASAAPTAAIEAAVSEEVVAPAPLVRYKLGAGPDGSTNASFFSNAGETGDRRGGSVATLPVRRMVPKRLPKQKPEPVPVVVPPPAPAPQPHFSERRPQRSAAPPPATTTVLRSALPPGAAAAMPSGVNATEQTPGLITSLPNPRRASAESKPVPSAPLPIGSAAGILDTSAEDGNGSGRYFSSAMLPPASPNASSLPVIHGAAQSPRTNMGAGATPSSPLNRTVPAPASGAPVPARALSNSNSAAQLSVVVTALAAPLKLQRLTGAGHAPRVVEEQKTFVAPPPRYVPGLSSSASQPLLPSAAAGGAAKAGAPQARLPLTAAQRATQQLIAQAQQIVSVHQHQSATAAVSNTTASASSSSGGASSSAAAAAVPVVALGWATKRNAHMLGALVSGAPIGQSQSKAALAAASAPSNAHLINSIAAPAPVSNRSSVAPIAANAAGGKPAASMSAPRTALLMKESIRAFNA